MTIPPVHHPRNDCPHRDIGRSVAAEALGTALLVAAVVGSGIMAERLAGGNVALALLANTLATGAMLVVLITIFGALSGAHFNPAVSLVMHMRGMLERQRLAFYIGAQVAGGVAGVIVAHLMFGLPIVQFATTPRSGAAQWFAEAVATFGLVLTILGAERQRPQATALLVGLYISAAYWFTASTSFANPAVTFARALSDTFAGIAPLHVPAFIAAQLIGAMAAHIIARWLWPDPNGRAARPAGVIAD